MGGFDPGWLALREPADAAARSSRLAHLAGRALSGRALRALDLGTGTGANVRYLTSCLRTPMDWLLVDDDARLVDAAARRCSPCAARRIDLRAEIESEGPGILADRDLVTASALLDLVSEPWLRRLAAKCRQVDAAVLFALTYDGEIRCLPEEPEDDEIRTLVNRHQRGDKGFGPALGPDAADVAGRCFADLGYHVERESSPWILTTVAREDAAGHDRTRSLQTQLIDGWAEAAAEIAPARRPSIERWRARRLAHVMSDRSRLVVGHVDLAGWLP